MQLDKVSKEDCGKRVTRYSLTANIYAHILVGSSGVMILVRKGADALERRQE